MNQDKILELKNCIDNCKHLAFFGGAGVSTESGIPDFRSKDGLYNQKDVKFDSFSPEYLLSRDCLYDNPKVFYEFYRQKMDTRNIEPNITHKWLAKLEESGKRVSVITQNIDGLHQKAGSREVYEIHGTTLRNYCDKCNKIYPEGFIFESDEDIPRCPECKGASMVRPDVTLYGETLPKEFNMAIDVLTKADVMIVAGTSLTVYPAASLVQYFSGKKLIIINRDATSQDSLADMVFHEGLGDIISKIW